MRTPFFIALFVAALAVSAASAQEREYFYVNDAKMTVAVDPGHLGAIGRDKTTDDQVKRFAASMGMALQEKRSGGLFVLALREKLEHAALLKFMRTVRARGAELFRDVGLIVKTGDDTDDVVMTDEVIVQLKSAADMKKVFSSGDLTLVRAQPFTKSQYLARVAQDSPLDAAQVSARLQEGGLVIFAQPNFWRIYARNETIPNDPMFGNQWHHKNTGQNGGTPGADAKTSFAWDFTTGTPSVIIGIVDNGFDIAHEDLAPNLFVNTGEIPNNGIDDDGNGFIDDVNGWNFIGNSNNVNPVGAGDNHGTAVTGVAIARGNNALGVSGACPNCRFMPLNVFTNCSLGGGGCLSNDNAFAGAITYAGAMGAKLVNNSWGQNNPGGVAMPVIVTAINSASANGSLVLFAGGNSPTAGWCAASYPSLVNVYAISSSSNLDRKVTGHAFGNCIGLLSPTRWGAQDPSPTGNLAIVTTDRSGNNGYNNADPDCIGGLVEPANTNYTNCFNGTSSATPLASGIAGLLLSANSSLTRWQTRRLLQDTADKIEDSQGQYSPNTGYSAPPSNIGTHSWGRVNSLEAVRIAAPANPNTGAKGGVDIFLRDNRLDWGNTPSNVLLEPVRGFIGHWQSMDIKIDAQPFGAPPTAATFDSFVDETPTAIPGQMNHVFVRVRNRGPVTAAQVLVKLHWAQFGTALPPLPADFWSSFPNDSADTTGWHPLGVKNIANLAYSGASVAGCPGRAFPSCGIDLNGDGDTTDPGETSNDDAQIVEFDFPAPAFDPNKPNHFCLWALVDSPQDPILPSSKASFVVDNITPTDNNATHRNYFGLATMSDSDFAESFYVRNPTRKQVQAKLVLAAPREWRVQLDRMTFGKPFVLKPGQEVLVHAKIHVARKGETGDLTITQLEVADRYEHVMGGLTLHFQPDLGHNGGKLERRD